MTRREWLGLGASFVLCFGVAAIGARFTPGAWYEQLAKPTWTPPGGVFAPVWTILYALMAVAAWLVWKERGFPGARVPLGLFGLQLALNATWSWLFFGLQRPGLAMIEITLLWAAILATILAFRRVRPLAGFLLAPYLIWVTFAGALNFEIWRLNASPSAVPGDASAPPAGDSAAQPAPEATESTLSADLRVAVQRLLRGPAAQPEPAAGQSWFSAATADALRSASVDSSGRATVDFHDLRAIIPNASSSAGSAMLLDELNSTVFAVPGIRSVEYRMEGSCELFWEWLQYGCHEVMRDSTSQRD